MIPYVEDLGRRIETSWIRHGYDERRFPEVVLSLLAELPPSEHLSPDDIVDWTFGRPREPRQPSSPKLFGEPPILLFRAPRFYIEALFWRSGTTDIHQHAFTGVFTVLAGSSVHSHWSFETETIVNPRLLTGRLNLQSTETLTVGDARPILPGSQLIHQLFHLDLPSVTLVIRTFQEPLHLPQYKYLPPGLAIDPFIEDPLRKRRLIFLEAMCRGQLEGLSKYAKQWIDEGDVESMYYLFSSLSRRSVDPELLGELRSLATARHGKIMNRFFDAYDQERRTQGIIARRARVVDAKSRFLLALLMLLPDHETILRMLRDEFPHTEPSTVLDQAMVGMSGKQTLGFDYDGIHRLMFLALIDGVDEDGLMIRLAESYSEGSLQEQREQLIARAKAIQNSELLRPLMSHSSLAPTSQAEPQGTTDRSTESVGGT